MYIAEPNGSLRMPLRFLPLPFLHVCFACSVNCFLLLPFATRVPLFFGPLFLVGRSEHRPCLFIFWRIPIPAVAYMFWHCVLPTPRRCRVAVLASPSTSVSFASVASVSTWAAPSAPPLIRAIFVFPFWVSFGSYAFPL